MKKNFSYVILLISVIFAIYMYFGLYNLARGAYDVIGIDNIDNKSNIEQIDKFSIHIIKKYFLSKATNNFDGLKITNDHEIITKYDSIEIISKSSTRGWINNDKQYLHKYFNDKKTYALHERLYQIFSNNNFFLVNMLIHENYKHEYMLKNFVL